MMQTDRMLSETNEKGELDLHVDTNIPRSSVEVVIVVNALQDAGEIVANKDEWHAFVTRFHDICADAPLERGPQDDFEIRESME
jgi:hypothetical protein